MGGDLGCGVEMVTAGARGIEFFLLVVPLAEPRMGGERLNMVFVGRNQMSPIAIALRRSTTSRPLRSSTSTRLRLDW